MRRTGTIGWKCNQCGGINGLEAKFCRGCGAPASFGTPVDTSQRHTQGHQMPGGGNLAVRNPGDISRIPRDVDATNKKGSERWILLIAAAVVIIAVVGVGTFLIAKNLTSDKEKVQSAEPDSSQVEAALETEAPAASQPEHQETAPVEEVQNSEPEQKSGFVIGQTYYVQPSDGVKVRNEPSTRTDASILKREQVPGEYQSHLENGPYAVLKKGTAVTCVDMSDDGTWMKIAEGCWCCVKHKGEILISE